MIMGVGMGNNGLVQNLKNRSASSNKNGQNLLGGLSGDHGDDEDYIDDGDENL